MPEVYSAPRNRSSNYQIKIRIDAVFAVPFRRPAWRVDAMSKLQRFPNGFVGSLVVAPAIDRDNAACVHGFALSAFDAGQSCVPAGSALCAAPLSASKAPRALAAVNCPHCVKVMLRWSLDELRSRSRAFVIERSGVYSAVLAPNVFLASKFLGVRAATLASRALIEDGGRNVTEPLKSASRALRGHQCGVVLELDAEGVWAPALRLQMGPSLIEQTIRNIALRGWRAVERAKRMQPRSLYLSSAEREAVQHAGGGKWLRQQVDFAEPNAEVTLAPAPAGEVLRAYSFRMDRDRWEKLVALGGPSWVRGLIQVL